MNSFSEKIIKFSRKEYSFTVFWIFISVFYALVFEGAEFAGSPVNSLKGFLNILAQWGVVSFSAAMVLGIISLNRIVFAVLFPVIMLASGIAAYFRLSMGLSLTPTLLELTFINQWSTWTTVISFTLIAVTIVAALFATGIVLLRWHRVKTPGKLWIWLPLFIAGVLIPVKIPSLKAPVSARIPYSFYYSFRDWASNRKAISEHRDTYRRTPAHAAPDSPDVILVIGESLRPEHLQLNGYRRPTTPHLAKDTAVISFTGMKTDYLYTHASVPHIMTRAYASDEDPAYSDQSFITLFRNAGYRTAWLSNQDEVNTYAYFMHEGDTLIQCNSARNLYIFDKWFDLDLLPHFDNFMKGKESKKLAVLHTIGSHWWYPSHYPDSLAKFRPEVNSRVLSELSHDQIINSYDNTILATDDFLYKIISSLRNRNAILIYISDHGEALGEDGNYLHADDYPQLRNTACIIWTSPEFDRRFPEKVKALKKNADRQYKTDAIFHSVLDAASIETPVINKSKSLFHDPDKE